MLAAETKAGELIASQTKPEQMLNVGHAFPQSAGRI